MCFNFSGLHSRSPILYSGNNPSPIECMHTGSIFVNLNVLNSNLRYMAASKQTSKQACTHTHMRNVVPLGWGSLRLTPTKWSHSDYCLTYTGVHLGGKWGQDTHPPLPESPPSPLPLERTSQECLTVLVNVVTSFMKNLQDNESFTRVGHHNRNELLAVQNVTVQAVNTV